MTTNSSQKTHPTTALIVIDMEQGFLDPSWGVPHDLEGCRRNVAALIADFTERGLPIVLVRHDSTRPHSPLRVGQSGNDFFPEVASAVPDLLVTKTVNSSFLGTPDLAGWLRERGIDAIVLAGIQTNMCVETTARMGGNLGFAVTVALDATTTFPLSATGTTPNSPSLNAEQLIEATAVNLSGGGFAEVTTTESLLSRQPRSA